MRADLQQFYGIDLDRAIAGEHSPVQVAACVEKLPHGSRVLAEIEPDSAWTITDVLLATLVNHFRFFVHAMSGGKGTPPELIGPAWLRDKGKARKADAMAMPIEKLLETLSMPRRG